MASSNALSARRDLAQKRIIRALESHANEEDLEALKAAQIPNRDPQYQVVAQMELIAAIAESLPSSTGKNENSKPFLDLDEYTSTLLIDAGYESVEAVRATSDDELLAIDGIGPKKLEDIRAATAEAIA